MRVSRRSRINEKGEALMISARWLVVTSAPCLMSAAGALADPCHLPDGGMAFISTRCQQFGRCHAGAYKPSTTLYRGELDGHPDEEGKKRVEMDRESLQRIVDWMDVNSQFYGDYSLNRIEWQPPSPEGEKRLREAIARRFGAKLAAQPYAALVNHAHPSESRVLMAPLPVAEGGWGQIVEGVFSGKDDPAWQEMLELVRGSITPLETHDIAGTCGRDEGCRCGGCWVRQHLATRQATATGSPELPEEALPASAGSGLDRSAQHEAISAVRPGKVGERRRRA